MRLKYTGWMAAGLILLALVVSGCDSNETPAGPPADTYVPLSDEDAAFASAASGVYEQTIQTLGPQEAALAVLAVAQQDTAVTASGVSDAGYTAWARFRDGLYWAWTSVDTTARLSVGPIDRPPVAPARSIASEVIHFPGANAALLVDCEWPWDNPNEISSIASALDDRGYAITYKRQSEVTPEIFKDLHKYGFTHVLTHGATTDSAQIPLTWLATRSEVRKKRDDQGKVTYEIPSKYQDDFGEGRVGVMSIHSPIGGGTLFDVLSVSSRYMGRYCNDFPPNAGLFLNACRSLLAGDMVRVLVNEKNAGICLGWTDSVPLWFFGHWSSDYPVEVIRYLLGKGEGFPMNVETAVATVDPQFPQAKIDVSYLGDPYWGLVPRLENRYFSCGNKMVLEGYFGDLEGQVKIGASPVSILSWENSEILCTPIWGNSDPVFAIINGVESNRLRFVPASVGLQHFYPQNYSLGISAYGGIDSLSVSGPHVVGQWQHPQSSELHIVVNLSGRPAVGDTYAVAAKFNDTSESSINYVVCGINDNFAAITYPADGDTIGESRPVFRWLPAAGIVDHQLLLQEEITGRWLWRYWPNVGQASVTCGVSLPSGGSYRLHLHAFDENQNQATVSSWFAVE